MLHRLFFDVAVWTEVRSRIQRECNLLSIFPSNDRKKLLVSSNQYVARCMHERKEDSKESVADFIEDVIVKVRKFIDDTDGSKTKQVRRYEFLKYSISRSLWSLFISFIIL